MLNAFSFRLSAFRFHLVHCTSYISGYWILYTGYKLKAEGIILNAFSPSLSSRTPYIVHFKLFQRKGFSAFKLNIVYLALCNSI